MLADSSETLSILQTDVARKIAAFSSAPAHPISTTLPITSALSPKNEAPPIYLQDGLRAALTLDKAAYEAAEQNLEALLLITHPDVEPIVSLPLVLVIGDWRRFPRGNQVGSYLGSAQEPGGKKQQRLGYISKEGNTMLRWLFVEATIKRYVRYRLASEYLRGSLTKGYGVAKAAIAHKLGVRLYCMLRSGHNY